MEILIAYSDGQIQLDVHPKRTIGEIKQQICAGMSWDVDQVALMYNGQLLDDNLTFSQAGIPENAQLRLAPRGCLCVQSLKSGAFRLYRPF